MSDPIKYIILLITAITIGAFVFYMAKPDKNNLGSLSEYWESGGLGPGIIANNPRDPGGKSYGVYQMAIKTGTLGVYVKQSRYKTRLTIHPLGSSAFDAAWKQLAKIDPEGFRKDQHDFIKKSHFDPIHTYWTKTLGYEDGPVVNQVLWSIGVQHGGYKKIIGDIFTVQCKEFKPMLKRLSNIIPNDLTNTDREDVIQLLYRSRRYYVGKHVPTHLHKALFNRYKEEEQQALAMLKT